MLFRWKDVGEKKKKKGTSNQAFFLFTKLVWTHKLDRG